MKRVLGVLVGALLAWLIAPHLFAEFASVREKVVRADLPAGGEQLRIPIGANAPLEKLRSPSALISRVRHDEAVPLVIRIAVDDREVCAAEIGAGESRRIDCAVRESWTGGENHSVTFSATSARFTVEYLELATHYGALTPGPRDLIFGPEGFTPSQSSSAWHVVIIFVLITLSAWCVRDHRLPTVVSVIHLGLTVIVGAVMGIVIVAGFVSPYSMLIGDGFLERLLTLTALPAMVAGVYVVLKRLSRPGVRPVLKAAAVGLLVGGVYVSFATQRVVEHHGGNVSGLLLISHNFFDRNPMLKDRADLEQGLRFVDGGGYDGQFFYYIAFDPLLRVFRDQPRTYGLYMDGPPYRYGRVGFSALTHVLSGGRPERFPITMVSIVLTSLALCGALLAAIAQRYGLSAWYGLLIVLVPGFRQSVETTLPEPLAIAFFLAGYLCLMRQQWWACGALLGLSMLVRETGGALVLAVAAGLVLTGKWRAGAIVTALAFLPIVMWKGFVGWVFWKNYAMAGLMPHPDDLDVPFAGIRNLWRTIARGRYWTELWEMSRAGLTFSILTTAGGVLALVTAVKRPSAIAFAALFYGALTAMFNYKAVWLHPANAQRLTIDLFVALALVYLHTATSHRWLQRTFVLFWCATAWYVFYGAFEAADMRHALIGWVF